MIQRHSFSITSCNKDYDSAWETSKVYSFTPTLTASSMFYLQEKLSQGALSLTQSSKGAMEVD